MISSSREGRMVSFAKIWSPHHWLPCLPSGCIHWYHFLHRLLRTHSSTSSIVDWVRAVSLLPLSPESAHASKWTSEEKKRKKKERKKGRERSQEWWKQFHLCESLIHTHIRCRCEHVSSSFHLDLSCSLADCLCPHAPSASSGLLYHELQMLFLWAIVHTTVHCITCRAY